MIDSAATLEKFGYEQPVFRKPVVVRCDLCGKLAVVKFRERLRDENGSYKCASCVALTRWGDAEYCRKTLGSQRSKTERERRSIRSANSWKQHRYRERVSKSIAARWTDPDYRKLISSLSKARWRDEDYRHRVTAAMQADDVRCKILSHPSRKNKVSNLQQILYSVLDDFGVKYYREYDCKESDPIASLLC